MQHLKNGTRVHLIPLASTEAMTILVLYKVGSRNEALPVWGGSHFIEHLMFKGTKRRPSTRAITETIDRYGAQYNAFTGKERTGYYIKIDRAHAEIAIDVLGDMLQHSLFAAKEIVRERKVIIEEIKMYEENPAMHVEEILEDVMFSGHVLGRNIAGTPKTMTAMKRADILAYRDAYYVPANTVIVLAGAVPENAMALLEQHFGKAKTRAVPPPSPQFVPAKPRQTPRVGRQYKKLKQVQLAFGFPTVGRGHADHEAIRLLATILGGSMSSRLFMSVRERHGLCYDIRASVDVYDDVGAFVVRAGLDAARLPLACEIIMKEIAKMANKGVTAEELRKAKDHIAGGMKLRLEDSSDLAEFVGTQELFHGTVETLAVRLAKYERVTVQDIARVAKTVLDTSRMSVATVGPFKKDADILRHISR